MGAGTLLLVDDQPANLLACKALLSADLPGCQVIATTDPEEALGAARATPIDVALADVCMPTVSLTKPIDRLELIAKVRVMIDRLVETVARYIRLSEPSGAPSDHLVATLSAGGGETQG
jgi:DNA-binding NarL/FixJ family response regulator